MSITGAFAPLRERDFARLWSGQLVSNVGDWVNYVALTALVWHLTESAWMVAVLRACHAVPFLLLGPFAGVLVDRWNRKATLVAVDVVRAGLVLLFPFVSDVGTIFAITIVFNVVSTLFSPAKNSLIPQIVGERQLLSANSLSSTTQNMAMVLGPALGGLLLAAVGTAAAFYFDSVSFVLSAIAIASMSVSGARKAGNGAGTSPRQEMAEGLRFAVSRPEVRGAMLLEVGLMVGWGCINVIAIVIAERVLGGGATEYGLLLASVGAGSLLGALAIGTMGERWQVARFFPVGFGIVAIGVAVLAESHLLLVACFGYFLAGGGRVGIDVSATTVYQRAVPDGLRGRIFALRYTITHLAVIGANQATGFFTDAASVEPVLLTASVLLMGCAAASVLLLPALRDENRMDRMKTDRQDGTEG